MIRKLLLAWLIIVMPAMGAVLSSCAPTYDSIADQMVADTQKKADDGLLKLEGLSVTIESLGNSSNASDKKAVVAARSLASYAANLDFYNGLQSSLTALDARMTALPDLSTPKLTDELAKLEGNVVQMRALHAKDNILSSAFLSSARQYLDQQFKTLTVYELTIKSGSKPQ